MLALVCLPSEPAGAEHADVSGRWTFTVTNPQGPTFTLPATLEQNGQKVSGFVATDDGDVKVSGSVNGTTLALNWTLENFEPGLPVIVTLSGQVDGDSVRGTVDYGPFGAGEWTGSRRTTRND